MSWLEKLYRTYENNLINIGDRNDKIPLLPVCHSLQNAHIEVIIDGSGNFLRAMIIPKEDASTIIPATEESAGRTGSRPVSNPLCDKLQYIAGDFLKFGGKVTSGFAKNPQEPHEIYLKQLSDWCASSFKHNKVLAVQSYIKRGQLIEDLVSFGILPVDNSRKLLKKRPEAKNDIPEIFRVMLTGSSLDDAFIRWRVEVKDDLQPELQKDKTVWESWINYYKSKESTRGLCFVTGEIGALAKNHPKRIRYPNDGAKLISSNDTTGFTYLGRFTSADEAYGVGFEITQKAHNALRWLIARQGRHNGDQAIVSWAVSGVDIPDPCLDTLSLISENIGYSLNDGINYTAQEIGNQLSKLIAGYSVKLSSTDNVVVLVLDSATPGRMAIRFYRELTGSEFLERVLSWHDPQRGCTWRQKFSKEKIFIGAPAPSDIAEAAYGFKIHEDKEKKLLKSTVERLLPCIIDRSLIPRDIVELCVRRASNKNGVETWEWEKTLGVACALFNGYDYIDGEKRMKNQEEKLSAKETERIEKLKAEEAKLLAREQARKKAYLDRELEIEKAQKVKEDQRAKDRVDEEIKEQAKEKARKEVYLAREKIIAEDQEAKRLKNKKNEPL